MDETRKRVEISKTDLVKLLRSKSLEEFDLSTSDKTVVSFSPGSCFVYLNIKNVNSGENFEGRRVASFSVCQVKIDDDEMTSEDLQVLLIEKNICGRSLSNGANIAVLGFRCVQTGNQSTAIVLDRNCSKGQIFVVKPESANKRNEGRSSASPTEEPSAAAAATSSKNSGKPSSKYEYKSLGQLTGEYEHVNIFGVVKWFVQYECGQIKMKLTDPSLADGAYINCNLSIDSNQSARLPEIRQCGDILRLHRVPVGKTESGIVKVHGRMESRGLSAVVWDGRSGENMTPRMATSMNYTIEEGDLDAVRKLRQWMHENRTSPTSPTSIMGCTDLMNMSQLQPRKYGSLYVKVIGVCDVAFNLAVLRVTDATKPACRTQQFEFDLRTPIFYDRALSKAMGACVADIFIYDEHKPHALELTHGSFVLLKNVHAAVSKRSSIPAAEFVFTVHGSSVGHQFARGIYQMESTHERSVHLQSRLDGFNQTKSPNTSRQSISFTAAAAASSTPRPSSNPWKVVDTAAATQADHHLSKAVGQLDIGGQSATRTSIDVSADQETTKQTKMAADSLIRESSMNVVEGGAESKRLMDSNRDDQKSTKRGQRDTRPPLPSPVPIEMKKKSRHDSSSVLAENQEIAMSPSNGPVSTIKEWCDIVEGRIYEIGFKITHHNFRYVEQNPSDFFKWKCTRCDLQKSFADSYSQPFNRGFKCVKCTSEEGRSVPLDIVATFMLAGNFNTDEKPPPDSFKLEMIMAIEGEVAEAVLGKKAKYFWRDFRRNEDEAAESINTILDNLIGQVRTAMVEMKVEERARNLYRRKYIVKEWKK